MAPPPLVSLTASAVAMFHLWCWHWKRRAEAWIPCCCPSPKPEGCYQWEILCSSLNLRTHNLKVSASLWESECSSFTLNTDTQMYVSFLGREHCVLGSWLVNTGRRLGLLVIHRLKCHRGIFLFNQKWFYLFFLPEMKCGVEHGFKLPAAATSASLCWVWIMFSNMNVRSRTHWYNI